MAKRRIVASPAVIPPYQREFYSGLYESKRLSGLFDRQWLLNVLTFGGSGRLVSACLEEIRPHQKVLQTGATFGNQLDLLASGLGVYGRLDVVDVSLTQLRRVRSKYRFLYPYMNFINRDALDPINEKYDVIICYMLLHELPLPAKGKLINQILGALAPNGKAVFIDYNNAAWWHPLRWFIKMFNRLYQPFAERMWQSEIRNYVPDSRQYDWRKTTYSAKMYQKVVVTRKTALY